MLLRIIKESLYKIKQIIFITFFNHRYGLEIYSYKASLKAKYGKKVSIGRDTVIAPNVIIGDMSYVNENSWIEDCVIGKYCSISDHVLICPTEHNINKLLSHPILGGRRKRQVIIGNDVLISHGCTILEGVHIGNGAIIAAGAVVTKDVPAYTIFGGIPAHFIKNRFCERQIQEIERINLYEMSEDEIKLKVRI